MYNTDTTRGEFVYVGSPEMIAREKASVSVFRKQNGMDSNPHGKLVGTPESIELQLAAIRHHRTSNY